jgi:hypothetical protein
MRKLFVLSVLAVWGLALAGRQKPTSNRRRPTRSTLGTSWRSIPSASDSSATRRPQGYTPWSTWPCTSGSARGGAQKRKTRMTAGHILISSTGRFS